MDMDAYLSDVAFRTFLTTHTQQNEKENALLLFMILHYLHPHLIKLTQEEKHAKKVHHQQYHPHHRHSQSTARRHL